MKQVEWYPDVSLELFVHWWVENFNGRSVRTSLGAYYKLSVHVIFATSICYRNVSPTVGWSGQLNRTVYAATFYHKTVVSCDLNKTDKILPMTDISEIYLCLFNRKIISWQIAECCNFIADRKYNFIEDFLTVVVPIWVDRYSYHIFCIISVVMFTITGSRGCR